MQSAKGLKVVSGIAGLTVFWCSALAQNSENTLNTADKKFIKAAAQSEIAKVKLGQLAAKNGASNIVKHHGQTMVRDDFKFNEDLTQLAASKGITLPTDLSTKKKATIAQIEKLRGAAFDAAYIKDMRADDTDEYIKYYMEMVKGHSLAVRAFAAKNLDVIKGHLNLISSTDKMRGSLKDRRSVSTKR